MNHPQAYIFDLDGTLVDSLQDIADALNAALSDHHLPRAAPQQVREWVGEGLRTLCARAVGGDRSADVDAVVESARAHYSNVCLVHTQLYPNILMVLNLLKVRGARLAVLSNKPHAMTVRVVQGLQIAHFFDHVVGATSEVDRKPDPRGVRRLLDAWQCRPADCLFVGDSLIDIETAKRVEMPVAAVTWGFRPGSELMGGVPDFLVDRPEDLPPIVLPAAE